MKKFSKRCKKLWRICSLKERLQLLLLIGVYIGLLGLAFRVMFVGEEKTHEVKNTYGEVIGTYHCSGGLIKVCGTDSQIVYDLIGR